MNLNLATGQYSLAWTVNAPGLLHYLFSAKAVSLRPCRICLAAQGCYLGSTFPFLWTLSLLNTPHWKWAILRRLHHSHRLSVGAISSFVRICLVSAPCYCLLCIRDTQQYSLSLELEYNSLVRDHFSFPPPLPDPKHHLIRSSGMKSPFSNVSQSPLLQLSTELPEFPPWPLPKRLNSEDNGTRLSWWNGAPTAIFLCGSVRRPSIYSALTACRLLAFFFTIWISACAVPLSWSMCHYDFKIMGRALWHCSLVIWLSNCLQIAE